MTSDNITVHVNARYLARESMPEEQRYVYAYDIKIENKSDESVKLISRNWQIIDGNEQTKEVKGLGVVGQQPTIETGESYRYTSGVILETEVGLMQGSYLLKTSEGKTIEAAIPTFALLPPTALH